MVTSASRANRGTEASAAGWPETRLPARVATFLIWGEPTQPQPVARAVAFSWISGEAAAIAWVTPPADYDVPAVGLDAVHARQARYVHQHEASSRRAYGCAARGSRRCPRR